VGGNMSRKGVILQLLIFMLHRALLAFEASLCPWDARDPPETAKENILVSREQGTYVTSETSHMTVRVV
jgi:hypothetical protein